MNNGAMSATRPTADVPAHAEPEPNGASGLVQDRTSFEVLYQRHSREVWALAYARWMNADTAMDIMQEAFLRLWKKWEDGENILNPRAWLFAWLAIWRKITPKAPSDAMALIRRRP